jgi:hypothetical protein
MIHGLDRIDRILGNQDILFHRDGFNELINIVFGELIESNTNKLIL